MCRCNIGFPGPHTFRAADGVHQRTVHIPVRPYPHVAAQAPVRNRLAVRLVVLACVRMVQYPAAAPVALLVRGDPVAP